MLPGFNPSQVGYKRHFDHREPAAIQRFNPSQVGYKPRVPTGERVIEKSFNPSQVGYKLGAFTSWLGGIVGFQSLTGRLQTPIQHPFISSPSSVSIPHR